EAPSDRSPSPSAPLSEAILELAAALEYDYVAIFEFVRNEVELEWSSGSLRGAEGALAARRGNAADQASLLVALLRSSGAAARFVEGVIEVDVERLRRELGLPSRNAVPTFLARSGVAHQPIIRGGSLAAVQLEHVWVAARLPYTNYRGAVVDRTGRTWVPLDPAWTRFQTSAPSGVLDRMGFSAESFRADYLDAVEASTPLETLRAAVDAQLIAEGEPGQRFADQLATRTPVAENLGLLPSSLATDVVAVTAVGAELSAAAASVRIQIRAGADPSSEVVLSESLPLRDVAGRRLTISYQAATVDDHRLILAFGGIGGTPAYLVRVRPQLKRDGRTLLTGGAMDLGVAHRFEMALSGPWGQESIGQTLISGTYLAVALGAPTSRVPLDDGSSPADTEGLAPRLLSRLAHEFAAAWDASEDQLAGALGVTLARPVPSVALSLAAARVATLAGLPDDIDWDGVQIDAALRVTDAVGEARGDWRRLAALEGSALEHRVLEDLLQVESISTAKALSLRAADRLTLTAADVGQVDGLGHPPAIRDLILEHLAAGQTVEVPPSAVDLRDWSGSAWSARDPSTGAEGYFLAGGLRGGATAVDPENWPLQELASLFEDPFSAPPNENPLAGAVLEAIPELDGQFGDVDRFYPEPIGVVVRDAIGRPVQGAQVTFSLFSGGGSLGEGQSAGPVQVVTTDERGEALVRLKAGERTDLDPVLLLEDEVDRYRSQAGRQLVEATVAVDGGVLPLAAPIEAYAFPGPPTGVERVDSEFLFFESLQGVFSDRMDFSATDAFGNPVANVGVTVFAGEIDSELFQNMDTDPDNPGPTFSCALDPEPNQITFIDGRVDDAGISFGCPTSTPRIGECGRVLEFQETDSTGFAYIGVIGGDAWVRHRVHMRMAVPGDEVCRQLVPSGDPQAEIAERCESVWGAGATVSDPGIQETYNYSPRVFINSVGGLVWQNPVCSPGIQTTGRLTIDNLSKGPAARTLDLLPRDVQFSLMFPVPTDCESRGVPQCRLDDDRTLCEEVCADVEPGVEPCDFCGEARLDECDDDNWTDCLGSLGCNWDEVSPVCGNTRWTWARQDLVAPLTTVEVPFDDGTFGTASTPAPVGDRSLTVAVGMGPEPGFASLDITPSYFPILIATAVDGSVEVASQRNYLGRTWLGPIELSTERIGRFAALDPRIVSVSPEVVPLSDDGVTLQEIVVEYRIDPVDYEANAVEVRLYERQEELVVAAVGPSRSGVGSVRIPRGLELGGFAAQDLQLVVNPGGTYEVTSDFVPLQTSQRLIRSYSPAIRLSQETDLVNGSICTDPVDFTFSLNTDATVRLEAQPINGQDVLSGEVDLGVAFPLFTSSYTAKEVDAEGNEVFTVHREELTIDDLPPGDYVLNLVATAQDGSEVRQARALSELRVTDQLPLAHTLIKGVDVWNGALTMSHQDFTVPG
ncbi:MAG: transglutaminase domain-containing protein, partial [Acidobacteriota bacterium]